MPPASMLHPTPAGLAQQTLVKLSAVQTFIAPKGEKQQATEPSARFPQTCPGVVHSPHEPPQPSSPHGLPLQSGMHSVVVVVVEVVVVVVGHGVVRGRHLRKNVSRSLSGLVPFGAVALAESRTMAGCVPLLLSGSGIATKLPQAAPSREPGTAPARLGGLTKSFWSPVGGWQAARFGSVWLMQTAALNVQEPLPHSPSVSQGSPSVQETTRPLRTSGPGLSMPTTSNST